MTSSREICPEKSPKKGVNRQFQAKTPNSIHRDISGTINPTNKRFEDRVRTRKDNSLVVCHYPKAKTSWLMTAILKIDITTYFRCGIVHIVLLKLLTETKHRAASLRQQSYLSCSYYCKRLRLAVHTL